MTTKRVYYIMLGTVSVLLVGIMASTYFVNGLLQQKAKNLNGVKQKSSELSAQQQGLSAAKKQVAQYSELKNIAKTIVPQDKDQAAAVREIVKLATESGISRLSSITFPASSLGSAAAKAGAAATSGSAASAKPVQPGLTQLAPAVGLPGVYQLQITITQGQDSRVTYAQFYDFLSKLEQNRRTAQVTSISLQPDTVNPNNVAFTLVINEFIKP